MLENRSSRWNPALVCPTTSVYLRKESLTLPENPLEIFFLGSFQRAEHFRKMKGMKGKLLKKLKSIKPIDYLKQERILQVKASDGYVESLTKISTFHLQPPIVYGENEPKKIDHSSAQIQELEVIDVTELMKDLEDEEDMDFDENDNKENIGPCSLNSKKDQLASKDFTGNSRDCQNLQPLRLSESADANDRITPLSEIDISAFRKPDLNSCSLFDPNLLAAFEQAVEQHARLAEAERRSRFEKGIEQDEEKHPSKSCRIEEDNPFSLFEGKCPPGGSDSVILYTTTLRGIRKTFEDCNRIRFLLENFRVLYSERDISVHMEFKEELWDILGEKTLPPRLFVKGRYIGGAEEVLSLHEQGKLRPLFEGIPEDRSNGPCEACGGFRFVLCFNCNGSHKFIAENERKDQCPHCNENGLILCPYCC